MIFMKVEIGRTELKLFGVTIATIVDWKESPFVPNINPGSPESATSSSFPPSENTILETTR